MASLNFSKQLGNILKFSLDRSSSSRTSQNEGTKSCFIVGISMLYALDKIAEIAPALRKEKSCLSFLENYIKKVTIYLSTYLIFTSHLIDTTFFTIYI